MDYLFNDQLPLGMWEGFPEDQSLLDGLGSLFGWSFDNKKRKEEGDLYVCFTKNATERVSISSIAHIRSHWSIDGLPAKLSKRSIAEREDVASHTPPTKTSMCLQCSK